MPRLARIDANVDYAALEAACMEASERYPHATKLMPLLSHGEALVEVWIDGRARTYVPEHLR